MLSESRQIADIPAVRASGDGADADFQVQESGLRDAVVEAETRTGPHKTQRSSSTDDNRVRSPFVFVGGRPRFLETCWPKNAGYPKISKL